jgi:hypothetical protein
LQVEVVVAHHLEHFLVVQVVVEMVERALYDKKVLPIQEEEQERQMTLME